VKEGIKLVNANNLKTTLSKSYRKRRDTFKHVITHERFRTPVSFKRLEIGRFLTNFNRPEQTPTGLENDLLIGVLFIIIARIRCLLICERRNRISKGK